MPPTSGRFALWSFFYSVDTAFLQVPQMTAVYITPSTVICRFPKNQACLLSHSAFCVLHPRGPNRIAGTYHRGDSTRPPPPFQNESRCASFALRLKLLYLVGDCVVLLPSVFRERPRSKRWVAVVFYCVGVFDLGT